MLKDRDNRERTASRQRDGQPGMVVGIGASTGGMKAIQSFFSTMPAESGLAFVVILHSISAQENCAPMTLVGQTEIPVEEIRDGARPAANHVYVCPAHAIVRLEGGVFHVEKLSAPEEERSLIDTFFHSLAEDRQAGAIGIILSGNGTDGTLGLKAISDSGGITMVQEPATAGHESMPGSGATLGVADRVLPPEKMPDEILAYARHLQSLLLGDNGGPIHEQIGGALGTIRELLERRTEHNFKHYKTSTLVRRIGRRMQILRISTAVNYLERLEQDPEEVKGLFPRAAHWRDQFLSGPRCV
jgi:two-component system CheB/CheR fusion protein